ncbi:MAG TPA: DUF4874 domain-containing protein, partial [Draconibacterium sp.]|nr:DUF4874 domain-containing protein [Draconibacterium sp.]
MNKYKLFGIFAVALFFVLVSLSNKKSTFNENAITHNYTADLSGVFPNPERGWHNRRDLDGRGSDDDRDFSHVVAAGHTLVHSYIRLDDFKETDEIPQSFLNSIQEGLDAIRNYGLKVILRPTHVWSDSPSVPESRILKHIEQINAVISA